ncbi:uncharacterized protein LOC120017133 [Tripterygium wilfordii]|uniref:uncharacterized protein LOC120017121 n=1 Tax=Tripterygium wilfordii TaxID=458696 RepID=UPI0018F846AB|nr:uncharacterized protein LOC120017121 [Tripterygium wilfordii]XP_038726161.1 uncharacterized protein LOC120017133 [Tripterygium wilfordii]
MYKAHSKDSTHKPKYPGPIDEKPAKKKQRESAQPGSRTHLHRSCQKPSRIIPSHSQPTPNSTLSNLQKFRAAWIVSAIKPSTQISNPKKKGRPCKARQGEGEDFEPCNRETDSPCQSHPPSGFLFLVNY